MPRKRSSRPAPHHAKAGSNANPKRVYSVMKAASLLVRPNSKLRARRKPDTKKPRPTRPNEW
jgi:hypothetical protein